MLIPIFQSIIKGKIPIDVFNINTFLAGNHGFKLIQSPVIDLNRVVTMIAVFSDTMKRSVKHKADRVYVPEHFYVKILQKN